MDKTKEKEAEKPIKTRVLILSTNFTNLVVPAVKVPKNAVVVFKPVKNDALRKTSL